MSVDLRRWPAMFASSVRTLARAGLLAAALSVLAGCGDGGRSSSEARAEAVLAEPVAVAPVPIAANPITGDAAPEELGHAVFFRYRLDPGRAVRAIVVLVPGIASGASDFDYLARRLLARSAGDVEVWAFERRPNRLEDLTGMEQAERLGRADVAESYYFRGGELEGRRFAGFLGQDDVPFLSEWGIEVVVRDLMAVLATVPAERRPTNVVLAGHSLGVVHVLDFLGWDFDGDPATRDDAGYEQVAASVLVDAPIVPSAPDVSRDEYARSLAAIRAGTAKRYDGLLPMLAPEALAFAEVLGMRAHPAFDDPSDPGDGPRGRVAFDELPSTPSIDALLDVLFARGLPDAWLGMPPTYRDFTLTHEALLGLVFDDDFQPWNPLQVSAGFVDPASAVERRAFPPIPLFLDPGYALSDPAARYTWSRAALDAADPEAERTDLTRLAEAQWRGPSNYTEWYFATRPMLDGRALGNLRTFTPADWQSSEYHLDLFHTAAIDVPILSLGGGAGMAPVEGLHTAVRDAVADPTRDGIPRASDAGFRVRILPGYSHFDLLLADDSVGAGNPAVEEILSFASAHTEGEVLVP